MKDIDKMTDEELRIEIAKTKNWRLPAYVRHVEVITHEMAVDGDMRELEGQEVDMGEEYVEGDGEPPNWPADIAAAWELLEEIHGHTIEDNADNWLDIRLVYDAKSYTVMVCDVDYNYEKDREVFIPKLEAVADTAPLAICRAWLAWKRAQEVKK